MKSALLFAFVAVLTFDTATVSAAKMPATFKLCKKTDPNINECMRSSIEHAIRELKPGLPALRMLPVDPLSVTKITFQDGPGRPVNLNLELNNVTTTGFSQAEITASRVDFDKRIIEADIFLPHSALEADYVMNGKFLVLPLKGTGKCKMEITGLIATLQLRAEPMIKDGKNYWNVVHFEINMHSVQNFKSYFENLFNGDKILSASTNRVLNENWKQLWAELQPTFAGTFAEVFLQLSNIIFGKVPENDIFLD